MVTVGLFLLTVCAAAVVLAWPLAAVTLAPAFGLWWFHSGIHIG